MKKTIILLLIIIILGGFYYWKNNKTNISVINTNTSPVTSPSEITDTDKADIATALIEGRNLFRSGDVSAIRKYLVTSKPDKKFDQLPDSAIKSLSAFLVNNKENFTKEEILASKTWGINNSRVYVLVENGNATSRLEAVKIGDKWYRY